MARRAALVCWWAALACGTAGGGASDGGGQAVDAGPRGDGSGPDAAASDARATTEDAGPELFEATLLDQTHHDGTSALEAILSLGPGPFSAVSLELSLGTTCFPFEGWADNPPPPGHEWPEDCDAVSRVVRVIVDPPQTERDPPGIEVLRAHTPYGGPQELQADMTDLANAGSGSSPRRISIQLPVQPDPTGQRTGRAASWAVTLRVRAQRGAPPRPVLAVLPLADSSLTSSTATLAFSFSVPEGATRTRLELRATGEGEGLETAGCVGPSEAHCRREQQVELDGITSTLEVWTPSCASVCSLRHFGGVFDGFDYCRENPTGPLDEVRAARAGWCPSMLTPPVSLEATDPLPPGIHTIRHTIRRIAPGGSWPVSWVLVLYGPE